MGLGRNLPNEVDVRTYFAQSPAPPVNCCNIVLVTIDTHDKAQAFFSEKEVSVTLPQRSSKMLRLEILCRQPDWQLSSLAQVCGSSFSAFIPAVEHLYILEDEVVDWQDDTENGQWMELLHQFTAVKCLYVYRESAPHFVSTLQELVEERGPEVLPTLQTLFLEEPGPVQEAIEKFVAARQLPSHPITVSRWRR
jgi:hypothetical protein